MRRHRKVDSPIRYSRHTLFSGLREHLTIALWYKSLLECAGCSWSNKYDGCIVVTGPHPSPLALHKPQKPWSDGETHIWVKLWSSPNSLYFTTEIASFYEQGDAYSEVNIKGEVVSQSWGLHTEFETETVKGKDHLGRFYYRWEVPFLNLEDIKTLILGAIWNFSKEQSSPELISDNGAQMARLQGLGASEP